MAMGLQQQSNEVSVTHPTVLVVGVLPALRGELAPRLVCRGVRVLLADTSEDALYTLMNHAVDLVVAPTELPGLDAPALGTALLERHGPPLVVVHRGDEAHLRPTWLNAGIADCIAASEPPEQMEARCAVVLRRATRQLH